MPDNRVTTKAVMSRKTIKEEFSIKFIVICTSRSLFRKGKHTQSYNCGKKRRNTYNDSSFS